MNRNAIEATRLRREGEEANAHFRCVWTTEKEKIKEERKWGQRHKDFFFPFAWGVSVSIQRKNKVQGIIIIIQQCRHSWPTVTSFHSLFIPFPAYFQGVPLRAFVREATLLLLLTRRLGGLLLSIRDERVGRKKKKKKKNEGGTLKRSCPLLLLLPISNGSSTHNVDSNE